MIDTENLRLGKHLADLFIDLLGACQVAAEGLFQHHTRIPGGDTDLCQVMADCCKQAGRRCEIVHARHRRFRTHGIDQRLIGAGIAGVECHVINARTEPIPNRRIHISRGDMRLRCLVDGIDEYIPRPFMTANADNA